MTPSRATAIGKAVESQTNHFRHFLIDSNDFVVKFIFLLPRRMKKNHQQHSTIRLTIAYLGFLLTSVSQFTHAADTLANNLSNSSSGNLSTSNASWLAQGFSTTLTAYVLDSITLKLSRTGSATGQVQVVIYDASGAQSRPGTEIALAATINVASALTTSPADIPFNGLNVVLAPNTAYYLVLKGIGSGSARWSYTAATTGTGFPSNYSVSTDNGTSWSTPVSFDPLQMSITAVPEPSTYVLAGLSAFIVTLMARRRRGRMG